MFGKVQPARCDANPQEDSFFLFFSESRSKEFYAWLEPTRDERVSTFFFFFFCFFLFYV
jgi:hypothetical protein